MKKLVAITSVVLCGALSLPALAQQTKGTVLMVSGSGEVHADNDQARATFFVEEQDKNKAVAASRVNQKMKDGTELLKKADQDGKYATRGYYTYPVYADSTPNAKTRTITGWRVGQYLDLTTKNIQQLPATVAGVQQVLALNGLNFGLSDEAAKQLEAKRLESAYKNLQDRVAMIAKAMGRDPADSVIESLDFDGSAPHPQPVYRAMMVAAPMQDKSNSVAETSFEPGDSTLSSTVVAKIKFN